MTITLMCEYVECPACGAERGERCRTLAGKVRTKPHLARERAAHTRALETKAREELSQGLVDLFKETE